MSRDKMTTTSVHLNDHSQCVCVCNSVSVLKSCNRKFNRDVVVAVVFQQMQFQQFKW